MNNTMKYDLALFVFFFSFFFFISFDAAAQETMPSTPEEHEVTGIESLAPEIDALKEEIIELNTLLFRLQEDLLFPEDSSIIVFLSIEGGHYFTLDAVKLHLNDTLVSSHLYTEREVSALKKGGIQRLYAGNLKMGEHQLVAIFSGIGPQERDTKRAETIIIHKEKGATFIKLVIRDNQIRKDSEFTYETWH
ncbi:MAG: AraC family transcriptional regulator [Nitrospiria bacterium]